MARFSSSVTVQHLGIMVNLVILHRGIGSLFGVIFITPIMATWQILNAHTYKRYHLRLPLPDLPREKWSYHPQMY